MIIVMSGKAAEADIQAVAERIAAAGLSAHVSRGLERTVIGAVGEERGLEPAMFEDLAGVERALRVVSEYRIVSREAQPEGSAIRIGHCEFGDAGFAWLGGCASARGLDELAPVARSVSEAGGGLMFGGGARRHGNPYQHQTFGVAELEALREVSSRFGLAAAAELSDVRLLDMHLELQLDALLIAPDSLRNIELLREIGRINKPVILQRDNRTSPAGWLLAAERIAAGGNHQIVLCDCGREGDGPGMDVGEIAWLRQETHLPVIAAPVAAGGQALAQVLARAALVAGASGLLLETDRDGRMAAGGLADWLSGLQPVGR
ncbi:hypothetical protein [Chromobacterium subtsugae]|uniref:hypothetical protein n=1 Tax=Chromobacterium subtsugae TaxID=251747 RepID=UPI00069AEB2D|nr:hypothetical protein [Chromobacterium subtsugae]